MITDHFFSVRQIEEYFAPRIDGMECRELHDYLVEYCNDHEVVCGGNLYNANDLFNLLAVPDFNPVNGLEYLGW